MSHLLRQQPRFLTDKQSRTAHLVHPIHPTTELPKDFPSVRMLAKKEIKTRLSKGKTPLALHPTNMAFYDTGVTVLIDYLNWESPNVLRKHDEPAERHSRRPHRPSRVGGRDDHPPIRILECPEAERIHVGGPQITMLTMRLLYCSCRAAWRGRRPSLVSVLGTTQRLSRPKWHSGSGLLQ